MRGIDHQIKAGLLQHPDDVRHRDAPRQNRDVFRLWQEGLAVFRGDAGRHAAGLRI